MKLKCTVVLTFLVAALGMTSYAQKQPVRYEFENHPESLTISHLTGDYYIFTTCKLWNGRRTPSNGMYVVTNDGVVLFDSPYDETQFQPLLDSILQRHHKKVVLAIATHYHDDRTGAFEYLKDRGIKTYSTKQTLDLCKKHNEKQAQFQFEKDTTFTVGNHTFQTYYPGEGHTKDNIVIWCKDKKVLYAGCFSKSIENDGLGNIADANLAEWPSSTKRVIKKFSKPRYIIPGHYSWKGTKHLKHTLNLLHKQGYH